MKKINERSGIALHFCKILMSSLSHLDYHAGFGNVLYLKKIVSLQFLVRKERSYYSLILHSNLTSDSFLKLSCNVESKNLISGLLYSVECTQFFGLSCTLNASFIHAWFCNIIHWSRIDLLSYRSSKYWRTSL